MVRVLLCVACLLCLASSVAAEVALSPFYTRNMNPFVSIYGLPAAERAKLVNEGQLESRLVIDVANDFTYSSNANELVDLDGETYRGTFVFRWGVDESLELGLDVPLQRHSGGTLDGFIEDWHSTFSLYDGGRDEKPKDQLRYEYQSVDAQSSTVDSTGFALGDVLVSCAWQTAYDADENGEYSSSIRSSVKLPSGESGDLNGSGSLDASIRFNSGWIGNRNKDNTLALFTSIGALYLGRGDVIPSRQRHWVGFGSVATAWQVFERVAVKMQLDGHTPFYNSSLRQLGDASVQLVIGGVYTPLDDVSIDFGVSEDVVIDTASDVVFHLSVAKLF